MCLAIIQLFVSVATPYIHTLAPRLVENLHADNARNIKNETELALVLESITTVEGLITLAEPQHRMYCYFFLLYKMLLF